MRLSDFAAAGLRHHRRSHVAVALGVAVATAVLTGALLVGDSVRGSLRGLTLQRLGNIDLALVTQQPFRAALADEVKADSGNLTVTHADAAWLLRGSLTYRSEEGRRYASGVSVVGCGPTFDKHGAAWATAELLQQGVVLTRPLADELGVGEGDRILLRLPTINAQPADSTLGEKSDTTVSRRLTVAKVIEPSTPLARFSLAPSQRPPRNLFVDIEIVQKLLDRPDSANAVLVDGVGPETPAPLLNPALEDYGLQTERLDNQALQIESDQLVLPDTVVDAVDKAFGKRVEPVVTYLANTIRLGQPNDASGKSIPYSTVTGVDRVPGEAEPIADEEIVLNDWAAGQLGAKIGDTVTIAYYEPESTHGELIEAEPVTLRVKAIVPIEGPAGDPRLTPVLEGVTDADSIGDWDLPFELVEPISRADEDYWDDYSTTPKAFVSLTLAKRLWATRWGSISLIRIPNADATAPAKLRDAINPADLGFAFQPVKELGLKASSGSTPFDGLFFGFSLFLIASAVMLIVLLFGLGVEQRAREVGLLSAIGWKQADVRRVLMREGLIVAAWGVTVGVPAGVFYAWLMVKGLTTVWVAAIAAPFLSLHVTAQSLAIGAGLGIVFAWVATRWSLRGVLRRPARALLAGQTNAEPASVKRPKSARWVAILLLAFALGVGFAVGNPWAAGSMSAEAQAGAFFAVGAMLLAATLLAVRELMARRDARPAPPRFGGWALALRNVARSPGRSLLTIALVACASFLILAISAFRLDPTEEGTGGFVLVGQSDRAIHFDLNTPEGRLELGFDEEDELLLDRFRIYALRVHDGEDASCLNLYQTRQPRVLGVADSQGLTSRFASTPAGAESESPEPTIPVTLDFNTAMYSLKLYGGVGSRLTIRDGVDRPVDLEVSGLLKNSILQGDLLVGESDFLKLYPETGGYRFFLIEPLVDDADPVELAAMLEDRLSDYGFDTEDTEKRLAGFLAVQNTYLSTFQSLGALGLLLGAVGVAVVQMRNLAERRGELALMRATGFNVRSLRGLVLRENLTLLGGGLAVGAVAAAATLAPQALTSDARPPWLSTGLLLAVIVVAGLVVGASATRRATRAPITAALRGD